MRDDSCVCVGVLALADADDFAVPAKRGEIAPQSAASHRAAANPEQIGGTERDRVRPVTLGQAARIPGVTPAAVAILDVYLSLARVS